MWASAARGEAELQPPSVSGSTQYICDTDRCLAFRQPRLWYQTSYRKYERSRGGTAETKRSLIMAMDSDQFQDAIKFLYAAPKGEAERAM